MEPSRRFKSRVLIVDDDPRVLETTAAIVRTFGFSVRTAEDGFVALKILREVLPDIILSDLRMPGMSGFELLSIVRRRFPHIPTIAISGEYILATMPLGLLVDHFFQKGDLDWGNDVAGRWTPEHSTHMADEQRRRDGRSLIEAINRAHETCLPAQRKPDDGVAVLQGIFEDRRIVGIRISALNDDGLCPGHEGVCHGLGIAEAPVEIIHPVRPLFDFLAHRGNRAVSDELSWRRVRDRGINADLIAGTNRSDSHYSRILVLRRLLLQEKR